MDKNFLIEQEHLDATKKEIKTITDDENQRLKSLPKMYASDPRLLASLMSITATKLNNLKNSFESLILLV